MIYYRLFHKQTEHGDETINHLFNQVGDEHPLVHARRRLRRYFPNGVPEFKKVGERKWRLNGIHHHPVFINAQGIWYVEFYKEYE